MIQSNLLHNMAQLFLTGASNMGLARVCISRAYMYHSIWYVHIYIYNHRCIYMHTNFLHGVVISL